MPFYEHAIGPEVVEFLLSARLRSLDLSKPIRKERYVRAPVKFFRGLGTTASSSKCAQPAVRQRAVDEGRCPSI